MEPVERALAYACPVWRGARRLLPKMLPKWREKK